jgi:anhydro-N-acetylmuramic acid kinase
MSSKEVLDKLSLRRTKYIQLQLLISTYIKILFNFLYNILIAFYCLSNELNDIDEAYLMMKNHSAKRIIGLISGTSVDGIDAALIEVRDHGSSTRVHVWAHDTYAYPENLQAQLLAAAYPDSSSVDLICHLNAAVGACFAEAAIAIAAAADVPMETVDLIGSHGQTMHHIPVATTTPLRSVSTLQIGEPCVIAERTGVTTVADFRPRDMAAGGLGAPLAPYGHYQLFADPQRPKLVQNIGGIANVSALTETDIMQTLAFDTGPGNMLIDEAARHATGGRQHFDADGRLAAQGQTHAGLLAELLQHPFLTQPPPKATGREAFGKALWQRIRDRATDFQLSPADIARTCTAFTVESIALSYERFIFPQQAIDEIIVCGGGADNPLLMKLFRQRVQPISVVTPEHYGYPNAALEAIIFAMLAHATIHNRPSNIPRATGATHPVVLGKIIPGRNF